MKQGKKFVLIISGPTASGKTDFAEMISDCIDCEIINADMGQFYTPFSIGTAKPDWKNSKTKQYLFDIIDEPKNLTAFQYYNLVLDQIKKVWSGGKIPIVVGGALFYIKSLYFPPQKLNSNNVEKQFFNENENMWKLLDKIDTKRASDIHPNDTYRIKRALEIWETTGIKPSEYKPKFCPEFSSIFVFINPDRDLLIKKINKRTKVMMDAGWIEEARKIMGTSWEEFVVYKGLIGYQEIFKWIRSGEKRDQTNSLIESVQIKTRQYAKKQITFWKSLEKQLFKKNDSGLSTKTIQISDNSNNSLDLVLDMVNTTNF